jgi:hypothetical protein
MPRPRRCCASSSASASERPLLLRSIALLVLAGAAVVVAGCGGTRAPAAGADQGPPLPPPLTAAEIAARIDARVPERAAWAQAVADALQVNGLASDASAVCAVLAVISQESSFRENPVVPGLAKVVAARIERYESRLGPLGRPLFRRLLAGRAPADPRPFQQRLAQVRTERDLDVTFRDLLAYHQSAHPMAFDAISLAGKLFDVQQLADLNPITTAGSMQVSVRFAEEWARAHHGDPATARDALYTRAGGVAYGTARLLAFPAGYSKMLHRFADYNAGVYASRNAALQAQLGRLVGVKLALDGDFLAYDRNAQPTDDDTNTMTAVRAFRERHRPGISDRRAWADARKEKTLEFENTELYGAIKAVYAEKVAPDPEYAVLPQVVLDSPKLSRTRTTAWFAEAVNRKYQECLKGRALR